MTFAKAAGCGAVAGLIGTGAMTGAQTVEMGVTGREPSFVPGEVAARLSGMRPEDPETFARMSLGVHWVHGMTQGVVRGLLGRAGAGSAVHFAMMWTSDALLYRALGIAPWPWEWSGADLATDVLHKGLFAAVTGAAYERMASR